MSVDIEGSSTNGGRKSPRPDNFNPKFPNLLEKTDKNGPLLSLYAKKSVQNIANNMD